MIESSSGNCDTGSGYCTPIVPPNPNPSPSPSEEPALTKGQIAGIVIGVIAFTLVAGIVAAVLLRRYYLRSGYSAISEERNLR